MEGRKTRLRCTHSPASMLQNELLIIFKICPLLCPLGLCMCTCQGWVSSHPLSFLANSHSGCFLSEASQFPGMRLNAPSQELHDPCLVTISLLLCSSTFTHPTPRTTRLFTPHGQRLYLVSQPFLHCLLPSLPPRKCPMNTDGGMSKERLTWSEPLQNGAPSGGTTDPLL